MGRRGSIVAASKQEERAVAEFLGGRRLHAGEWQGPGDVDVVSPRYIAQVKHRSNVADYIIEGMKQIHEALTAPDELRRLQADICEEPIPLVIVRTKPGRGRKARTFVVLEQIDFNRIASGV